MTDHVNKFWTLLSRSSTNSFGRAVTDAIYKPTQPMEDLHSVLVPDTEQSYTCLCVEQLLQTVLMSSFRDSLLSSDSFNTYEKPLPFAIQTTNTITKSYAGIDVYVTDEGASEWTTAVFSVILDSGTMQASVASSLGTASVQPFTITDDMSSKITLSKDFYLRFKGTLPVGQVNISVESTLVFNRNIKDILDKVGTVSVPWINRDYKTAYTSDPIPMNRLAAVAMNLYEGLSNV